MNHRSTPRRVTSGLLLLLLLLSAQIMAQQQQWDVRDQDTIIVGEVVVTDYPWPDSIGLPIYIWADDSLGGFSLSFRSTDPRLFVSSFSHEGTVFDQPGTIWTSTVIDSVQNAVGFGYFNNQGIWQPNPQGLIGTIYFDIDPSMPGGSEIDIDSTFIEPILYFEITTVVRGYPHSVLPAPFSNRGGANVHFEGASYVCGDADGNMLVNISDAVYLIAYIFGSGPTPEPLAAGDADCNGLVNISDAVYLIAYIFGGGPDPCTDCP